MLRRPRPRLVVWAVAGTALLAGACPVAGAPYRPHDDSVVLERLPTRPNDPVARELDQLRARHRTDPTDMQAALPLAYGLRRTWLYRRVVLGAGSAVIACIALGWMVERWFDLRLLS